MTPASEVQAHQVLPPCACAVPCHIAVPAVRQVVPLADPLEGRVAKGASNKRGLPGGPVRGRIRITTLAAAPVGSLGYIMRSRRSSSAPLPKTSRGLLLTGLVIGTIPRARSRRFDPWIAVNREPIAIDSKDFPIE